MLARTAWFYAERASSLPPPGGEPKPVYWQWRRLPCDWTPEFTFDYEVFATTPNSEVRALYASPLPAHQVGGEAVQQLLSDARSAMIRYGTACLQGSEEGIRSSTTDACTALDGLAALASGVTGAGGGRDTSGVTAVDGKGVPPRGTDSLKEGVGLDGVEGQKHG
jgi:hypothetical protein